VPCLESVQVELYDYLIDRGRVWRNCVFQGGKDNNYAVNIDKYANNTDVEKAFPANRLLYVFDEGDANGGGCFLGEFKISQVDKDNKRIILTPTTDWMSKEATARIKSNKGLWTMFEIMPKDMHIAFEDMTEEERKALPASIIDDYLAQGRKRQLRDYYVLLKSLTEQRTELVHRCEVAKRNRDRMLVAEKDATEKQLIFRQNERATLIAERDRMQAEEKAAKTYLETVQQSLATVRAKIDQLISDNRVVAKEMAKIQSELVRRVDQRTAVASH
jgi:hypothetical protein